MLCVFIDETSDAKFKDYLGFCVATINAVYYPIIKSEAQAVILAAGWDPSIEFKGSYIFSKSQGCEDVEIERRIDTANQLIDLHTASTNRRLQFHYGRMKSTNHKTDYLNALPGLLAKALPNPGKGAGKNLICVTCDERQDISTDELHKAIVPAVQHRGYVLYERVASVKSTFDTVGIMYADLVGYLAGRVDTISNDSELFEGLSKEQFERNGKIRKLRSSRELIDKIQKLSVYDHVSAT